MNRPPLSVLLLTVLLAASDVQAQAVRLEVRVAQASSDPSKMPEMVRKGTKTEALAPALRLEATVGGTRSGALPATMEWYVFGRLTEEASRAGRGATGAWSVMQHAREALTIQASTGANTSFFAYAPGQVRNGVRSEAWLVRLIGANGQVIDARASATNYLALARDEARLKALAAVKPNGNAQTASEDPDVPLEVMQRIKADAEKNWPGNPEMQAIEIKNKIEYHKSAYKK